MLVIGLRRDTNIEGRMSITGVMLAIFNFNKQIQRRLVGGTSLAIRKSVDDM